MLYDEILQLDLEKPGEMKTVCVDKVAKSIDRLRAFEPPEGYFLAFSGGKDSQCIYHLAVEAGVKFEAHYSRTTVDPPALIYFIREQYPDVIEDSPEYTMWELIVQRGMPPTRIVRYCCEYLKENQGEGRIVVTGVRWAESAKRKKRQAFEVRGSRASTSLTFTDNAENRLSFETCMKKGRRMINPIIDWETSDVWEYIHSRGLKYCSLYDEGYHRLGCIGCPLSSRMADELAKFPKYRAAYCRAFERMLSAHEYTKREDVTWKTGEDVMSWWLQENKRLKLLEGQMSLDEAMLGSGNL